MTSTLSTYNYFIKNQLIKYVEYLWKPVEIVEVVFTFHNFPQAKQDK